MSRSPDRLHLSDGTHRDYRYGLKRLGKDYALGYDVARVDLIRIRDGKTRTMQADDLVRVARLVFHEEASPSQFAALADRFLDEVNRDG
jgi:hypothetical protein